jgi:hypothetical protein
MKTIIRFSTGRVIGWHKQSFAACHLSDGRVFFYDLARDLEYITKQPCDLTQSAITQVYESGDYITPRWALRDQPHPYVKQYQQEIFSAIREVQS